MDQKSTTPTLSIIIVNWNTSDLVRACILSIMTHTTQLKYEIIVIDNASTDDSIATLHALQAEITIIKNSTNRGFAAAVNQGINIARNSYILLLNPDTYIIDNAFLHMIKFMEANPQIGILGPKLNYPDKTIQPSCRRFPTLSSQLLILLKLHNVFPNLKPLTSYFMKGFDYTHSQPVDQVMGACFLISPRARNTLGLLDESFFIWFEEVDYCKRAHDNGLIVQYEAGATVYHHKGKSFAQVNSPQKQRYINKSLAHYMQKHVSKSAAMLIRFISPLSFVLAFMIHVFHLRKPNKDL